jgi:hypothetical protein
MGAVITFPQTRRAARGAPAQAGAVIILPVIRIERDSELPTGSETTGTDATGTDATKSSSPRKRRRRASPP